MKTIEDLKLMGQPALESMFLQLTGNKPEKNLSKNQLAQKVYDLQQPDAPREEPTHDEDLVGEDANDDVPVDELAVEQDGDAVRPTEPDSTHNTPNAGTKQKKAGKTDERVSAEEVSHAVRALGINYDFDGDSVTFTRGTKSLSTTLKQPIHRIVAIAESVAR